MKASFEKVNLVQDQSFLAKLDISPYLECPWHYHPEFELVYVIKGFGKRFVGDSIDNFDIGDLALLGPNLPHVWLNDAVHYRNDHKIVSEVIVIQFLQDVFGKQFFDMPEMAAIRKLLESSVRGVSVQLSTRKKVGKIMHELLNAQGPTRITKLIEILELIATSDLELLSSSAFKSIVFDENSERISKVLSYISENFKENITISKMAELSNMNYAAFCRYFKEKTKKTFTLYINEIRLGYAKKLLIENGDNVSQVGYKCGYSSPSYFITQFKKQNGKTPLEYKRVYEKLPYSDALV